MAFKTIMAIIGNNDVQKDISQAIEAACEINAHLTVVVAGVAAGPTVGDYPVGLGWLEQRDEDLKVLTTVREQVKERCRSEDLSFDVQLAFAERSFLEQALFQRALYCDLAIIGQGVAKARDLLRTLVDAIVFHAHRPLILVPEGFEFSLKPKSILLAWNSKVEAGRAAREALDLLAQAEQVHVTVVDPDALYGRNGEQPGADVATYLARHGANVVVDQLASAGRSVEDVLQQHALETAAGLLVMGAYGHSRMRQRIFGGVTASMLQDAKVPVLLAR
ncbi:MAG TPA: universal stress protein [Pseudorhizobium sp.]|jgi:nucleotide-binding universal stress UspA family protein|nr:universal stress protein [Pseudorhizobium sp.]